MKRMILMALLIPPRTRGMIRRAAVFFSIVLVSYPCFAQSGEPVSDGLLKKIAILDFINTEDNPSIRYLEPSITSMVRVKLESRYSFQSLPEEELREAVKLSGVDPKKTAEFEGALAVGAAASRDFVITGSYVTRQSGTETIVLMRFLVVDIRQKSVLHEFTSESAVDSRLWDTIDHSTAQIADALKLYRSRPAISGRTYFDGHTLYVNGGVRFRFERRDDIAPDRVMYSLDGGEERISAGELPAGDEGPHMIRYYAVDKAGNREPDKYFHYTTDLSSPEITVRATAPVAAGDGKNWISGRGIVSVSADDLLSGTGRIMYSVNGGDFAPYVSGFALPREGEVKLRVTVEDKVGNLSDVFSFVRNAGDVEKSTMISLFPDIDPPAVRIVPGVPVLPINGKNAVPRGASFTVEGNDAGSGLAALLVRVDGRGEFIPYAGALVFNAQGNHFIEAKAIDRAGNESAVTVLSFLVDAIPPSTKVEEEN